MSSREVEAFRLVGHSLTKVAQSDNADRSSRRGDVSGSSPRNYSLGIKDSVGGAPVAAGEFGLDLLELGAHVLEALDHGIIPASRLSASARVTKALVIAPVTTASSESPPSIRKAPITLPAVSSGTTSP